MTHSPEPWRTDFWCDGPVQVMDAKENPVCGYVSSIDGFVGPVISQTDDLERIVACVNACAGVDLEILKVCANDPDARADIASFMHSTWRSLTKWKPTPLDTDD